MNYYFNQRVFYILTSTFVFFLFFLISLPVYINLGIMRLISIITGAVFILACSQGTRHESFQAIYQPMDTILVNERLSQFAIAQNTDMPDLMVEIAKSFMNFPYVAKTLEQESDEKLVVNLREFDCTTLIESAMAIGYATINEKPSFNTYLETLQHIRYRQGTNSGYTSRLHYFTDWITDNIEKGFIADVTLQYGGIEYPNKLNFMSTHTYAYEQLKNDSVLVEEMKILEKEISNRTYYYIPENKIAEIEDKLKPGLIVAFTTYIEGLDVVHAGITYEQNGQIKLLHASTDEGAVVISDKTLSEYVKGNRLQTGIILLQAIFQTKH